MASTAGDPFNGYNPERCNDYAHFASRLNRTDFDGIYWTLFFVEIGILFLASWCYQWALRYRDIENYDEEIFRKKLKLTMGFVVILFLGAAAILVMEVYCLLALQFCDGEDLMSLYWSTWASLQLGSIIAVLGIVLAVWHHLCRIRQPMWALALGTPVLVVAGFGHVMTLILEMGYKKCRAKRKERRESKNLALSEKGLVSTAPSIKPTTVDGRSRAPSLSDQQQRPRSESTSVLEQRYRAASVIEAGQQVVFEIDVGSHGDVVRQWPSFVGIVNGKAFIMAHVRSSPESVMMLSPPPSVRLP